MDSRAVAALESGNFEDADFTDAVLEGPFVNNAHLKECYPSVGSQAASLRGGWWRSDAWLAAQTLSAVLRVQCAM